MSHRHTACSMNSLVSSRLQTAIVSQITIIFLFGETCFSQEGAGVKPLCVSLWLLGLPRSRVLEKWASAAHTVLLLFLCLLAARNAWEKHSCTFWLCLSCAPLLAERAEHRWGWSHACCQGTRTAPRTLTHTLKTAPDIYSSQQQKWKSRGKIVLESKVSEAEPVHVHDSVIYRLISFSSIALEALGGH